MSIGRLMALFSLTATAVLAEPPLTIVQDTIYKADGTLFSGSATIEWGSFNASDLSAVGMQTITVQIINGAFYVQLVPNTTAVPSEPYLVIYQSDGIVQWQETWMVPSSTTPLTIAAVRTSSTATIPPGSSLNGGGGTNGAGGPGGGNSSSGGNSSGPIAESNVTGLTSDLAARPVKGSAYGTSRVAMVDQNGALETVVGTVNDCVYVNGTSGPCFDPTQLPGYSDGEIPSGTVNGTNLSFGLANTPAPAQSLQVFRNGVIQKQGVDYTLTGSVVQFALASAPQTGDILTAYYRLPPSAQGGSGNLTGGGTVIFPTLNAQVLCSSAGTQTNSSSTAVLGTCTIPGGFLGAGDRVEIRFLLQHTGTNSGFNFGLVWGATSLMGRAAGTGDAMVSGSAEAAVTSGPTQANWQSCGTVLTPLSGFSSASDSIASPITLSFQASLTTGASDTVSLVNYSVVRYPAISNP